MEWWSTGMMRKEVRRQKVYIAGFTRGMGNGKARSL